MTRAAATIVFVAAAAAPLTSHAQPRDEARSIALFEQARKLIDAGQCNAAIPKLRESLIYNESIGAHLSLADCEEAQDPAAALHDARAAADLAERNGDDRAAYARARASAIETKVQAQAPPPPPPQRQVQPAAPLAAVRPAPAPASSAPNRTLPFVLVGAGAAGLATGTVAALLATSAKGRVDDACPSGYGACDPAQRSAAADLSTARTWATISTVAFALGGVALAAGVTLYVTVPSQATLVARW